MKFPPGWLFIAATLLTACSASGVPDATADSPGKQAALTSTPPAAAQASGAAVSSPQATAQRTAAADSEAAATSYPSAPPPENLPQAFRQSYFGTAERQCVDTTGQEIVRSGEFVAGPFKGYVEQWRPNMPPRTGKLWWVPLHSARMPGLTVTATRLDVAVDAQIYSFPNQAWAGGSGDIFYPSGIPLPSSGRWRLIAAAGPDWGCFEVTIIPPAG